MTFGAFPYEAPLLSFCWERIPAATRLQRGFRITDSLVAEVCVFGSVLIWFVIAAIPGVAVVPGAGVTEAAKAAFSKDNGR